MALIQKNIPLASGKRVGLKLDEATWRAIEWTNGQAGKDWRKWCADIIESTPKDENTTAAVRAAAMDALLYENIMEGRAESMAAMSAHPLLRDSGMLDDAQLDEILARATVQGVSDLDGFKVLFGHDEHGQDCVWIKNGLRDRPHFAFIVPAQTAGGEK